MANYIGAKCPVCEQTFLEEDDVVVCPICGTPHHRACYQKLGKCAFEEQHNQGHTWTPPEMEQKQAQEPEQQQGSENCPACGAKNPSNSIFCMGCGARLGEQTSAFSAASNAYTAAFGGVSPNEEIAGVSARDLALYVGTGSHYFLPRFREITNGRLFTLNVPAILNFLYFFYRKMYGIGTALLGFYIVVQIPSLFYAYEKLTFMLQHMEEFVANMDMSVFATFVPQNSAWTIPAMNIGQYLMFAISAMLMLFGNHIYLHSAIRNIKRIHALCEKAQGGFDDKIYTEMLARRGRTNFGVVAAVIVAIFAVSLVISMAMLFSLGVFIPQL